MKSLSPQVIVACQMVVEERFLKDYKVRDLALCILGNKHRSSALLRSRAALLAHSG